MELLTAIKLVLSAGLLGMAGLAFIVDGLRRYSIVGLIEILFGVWILLVIAMFAFGILK